MAGPAPLQAASASPPSLPRYEDWILETIDSLRSRKARPDLERICRMVRRRHGPEPERTRQELERMVQRRAVLRVSYKGSISYRNAARLQPPRRSRGGGKAGNPEGAPPAPSTQGGESEGGSDALPDGGSPKNRKDGGLDAGSSTKGKLGVLEAGTTNNGKLGVQDGGTPKNGKFALLEGGSSKDEKPGGSGGWNPTDASLGVQGQGYPKDCALGDGNPKEGLSWVHGSPRDASFGMSGIGSPKDVLFGIQGFGSPKDVLFSGHTPGNPKDGKLGQGSPKGMSFGAQDLGFPKDLKFGEQGNKDSKNGKFVGLGERSPTEAKLWLQGELSSRELKFGAQLGGSHREARYGALGAWPPKDGRLGLQGPESIKDGKFGVLGGRSPKEVVSGMQREWSPEDGNTGVQLGGTPKEAMSGELSHQDGLLGVQEGWSPRNGKLGVQGDRRLSNWKLGVLGTATPKDGKTAVQEGWSPKEVLFGAQGGKSYKDGNLGGPGEWNPKDEKCGVQEEGMFGAQGRIGIVGEDKCVMREPCGALGEPGVLEKHTLGQRVGVRGEQSPGLQDRLGTLLEDSPKNGSHGPQACGSSKEWNPGERSPKKIGSKISDPQGKGGAKNMEVGFQGFHRGASPKDLDTGSAKEVAQGLSALNQKGFRGECQELPVKGNPKQTMPGPQDGEKVPGSALVENMAQCHGDQRGPKERNPALNGSSGPPEDASMGPTEGQQPSLRRAKRGTLGQEEEEPPTKRSRTESPEPGGERSRRSLGVSPVPEVSPASNTRSGSRRPPPPASSAPAPRVERLTRARGRWQQEEERDYGRTSRSRSRPDRSTGRPQESTAQSGRATRSKKIEDVMKDEAEEDVSVMSEDSELLEAEETCVDKSMKSPPAAPFLQEVALETEPSPQCPTDKDSCEKDIKAEGTGINGPAAPMEIEPGSPVAISLNLCAADHRPSDPNNCTHEKRESMDNTRTCPRIKNESQCNQDIFSTVKNTNGCSTNIGLQDKGSSVTDTICPRVKREEGCDANVCPLGECAVKAVPVETVKLEDDAGEPRDCEASLGIEGVEPHLPVRVSPVTPMVLAMDRTSYRKISVTKKPSNPVLWSVMDVVQYFTDAGFAEQASAFREQEIDGKSLLLMQRTDVLTGLSIRLGPALKMYEHHIKILQQCHFAEDGGFLA
ncbi:fibril-forming collagen alpha chain-like [Ambystoma mexicanum]|uniref:fibril-forming collagen alpha chain-like n=1 Tax=Ambystoma mexicanum TaxID=8296 RepID=UPI0037E84018